MPYRNNIPYFYAISDDNTNFAFNNNNNFGNPFFQRAIL